MNNLYQDLEDMCEIVGNEVSSAKSKLEKAGGKLNGDDVSYIDKLTHSLKSIKSTLSMMDNSDYSNIGYGYTSRTMPTYYGNSYARRRDRMGRYSSGYSRTDDMVSQLRAMMEDAPNEMTRQDIQRLVTKLENQ